MLFRTPSVRAATFTEIVAVAATCPAANSRRDSTILLPVRSTLAAKMAQLLTTIDIELCEMTKPLKNWANLAA
jgi:hypothetical protein